MHAITATRVISIAFPDVFAAADAAASAPSVSWAPIPDPDFTVHVVASPDPLAANGRDVA